MEVSSWENQVPWMCCIFMYFPVWGWVKTYSYHMTEGNKHPVTNSLEYLGHQAFDFFTPYFPNGKSTTAGISKEDLNDLFGR